MAQQITLRRGLSTEWSAVGGSLVLGSGEPGFETNTGKLKIGNGTSVWNDLAYVAPNNGTVTSVSGTGTVNGISLSGNVTSSGNLELTGSLNASINDLSDVVIGTLQSDHVLKFNGTNWVNGETPTQFPNITVSNLATVDTLSASKIDRTGTLFVRPTLGTLFGSESLNINGVMGQQFGSYQTGAGYVFSQHHSTADAINFTFYRTRGTPSAQTNVQSGDDLADITFIGNANGAPANGAAISVSVESAPSGSNIPTKFQFATNNGTATATRMELSSTGTLKVNNIQALTSNGDLNLVANGTGIVTLPAGSTVGGVVIGSLVIKGTVADQTALLALTGMTLGDAYVVLSPTPTHLWSYDGSAWVDLGTFQGPTGADGVDGVGVPVGGTIGQVLLKSSSNDYETEWGTASTVASLDDLTDVVISGTPSDGQVLKYDSGTSQWVNAEDATATIFARSSVSGTSSSLADSATGPINITGFKSYALLKIQVDKAAWVRIYTSEAARIADASRLEGTDPAPGAGIIAEVITTGPETIVISPGTIGFNDEGPVTTNVPCRVTNKSGTTTAITVTLTLIKLEV